MPVAIGMEKLEEPDHMIASWKHMYLTQPALKSIHLLKASEQGLHILQCRINEPSGIHIDEFVSASWTSFARYHPIKWKLRSDVSDTIIKISFPLEDFQVSS